VHIVILSVIAIDDLLLKFVRLSMRIPKLLIDGLDSHHRLADLRPAWDDDLRPRAGLVRRSMSRSLHGAIVDCTTLDETASLGAAGADLFVAVVLTFACFSFSFSAFG